MDAVGSADRDFTRSDHYNRIASRRGAAIRSLTVWNVAAAVADCRLRPAVAAQRRPDSEIPAPNRGAPSHPTTGSPTGRCRTKHPFGRLVVGYARSRQLRCPRRRRSPRYDGPVTAEKRTVTVSTAGEQCTSGSDRPSGTVQSAGTSPPYGKSPMGRTRMFRTSVSSLSRASTARTWTV